MSHLILNDIKTIAVTEGKHICSAKVDGRSYSVFISGEAIEAMPDRGRKGTDKVKVNKGLLIRVIQAKSHLQHIDIEKPDVTRFVRAPKTVKEAVQFHVLDEIFYERPLSDNDWEALENSRVLPDGFTLFPEYEKHANDMSAIRHLARVKMSDVKQLVKNIVEISRASEEAEG